MSWVDITYVKGGGKAHFQRVGSRVHMTATRKGGDAEVTLTRRPTGGYAEISLYGDYDGCVLTDSKGRILATINGKYLTVKT